jgi:AAA+ superfamily predicted ATPase
VIEQTDVVPTLIQLCGEELQGKRAVAAAACARVHLLLYAIPAHAVPHHPAELDALLRLWQREAVLNESGLLIDCDEAGGGDAARDGAIAHLLEDVQGLLIVSSWAPRCVLRRPMLTLEIAKPTAAEQRTLWRDFLGAAAARLNGNLEVLGAQFNFNESAIRGACAEALQPATQGRDLDAALWEACRTQARPRLDDLTQRIVPAATWEDLVLPETQKQVLREIEIHVRRRAKVYQTWGFATRGSRGLGISALFSGPSGTGKTMAGEVLAHELKLDLYRIDLSQVVSKYIGETEKNLRRVFDGAEAGCAILLFDEADALFGKRSEVKDSHDRYANVEISYLLQRMEAYRGLAILTTNMKSALDSAFQRRIRFVVQFPFPDAGQRAEIWRRVFPAETPVESLDYVRLARLQVAGGNIRNIAMNAAFLAADAEQPVGMAHLLQAARSEYAKLERPLTEAEIGAAR